MKRIASLIATLVIIAGTAGATYAYFADQAESTGNDFTTGQVDITVDNTFNVTDMYPGSGEYNDTKTVNNDGTLPFDYRITTSYAGGEGEGSQGLYDALQVIAEGPGTPELYNGNLSELDIIRGTLNPDTSEDLRFRAWLPETEEDQSELQNSSALVTFTFEARSLGGFGSE